MKKITTSIPKTRLIRKDYSNGNSYFKLDVRYVLHVWDTDGKQLSFEYNNKEKSLTVIGNKEVVYVNYQPHVK